MMPPVVLLIALAALVATNAATGLAWLHARDQVATLQERIDNTVDVARECSRGVEALQLEGRKRAAAAAAAIAAATARAAASGRRADQILASAPAVAGNDCASAQIQIDDWLANRQARP